MTVYSIPIYPAFALFEEGRSTAVAALGHMMRQTGDDGAGKTGHTWKRGINWGFSKLSP
jgi:hypothetical protein